ncbi:MAG: hypothetical protein IJ620_06910, partial [Bacteroidales bacterium]|nr:hypothetical protein [Bacteroidales bacterium]
MVKRLSLKLRDWWQHRSWKRKIYDIILYGFALTGVAIIGAWGVFQLGLTNNSGSVDKNYRYLMTVEEMRTARKGSLSIEEANEQWAEQYARLIAFSRFYPTNARLIMHAAHQIDDPMMVQRKIAAAEVYVADN